MRKRRSDGATKRRRGGMMVGPGWGSAVLALVAAGCASTPEPAAPPAATAPAADAAAPAVAAVLPAPPAEAKRVLSNRGTYVVAYTVRPDPVPLNETFSLTVWVCDATAADRPLTGVDLAVDGRMPQHRHGMNREPHVRRGADGSFTVTGMLFHMPGMWELHFDITTGTTTERAQADVELE